jgi:hypothetical protein
MEFEANRFAALLLMPPPLLRKYMLKLGDPHLSHILKIHDDFEVSEDAAARAYAQYHDEPIAVCVVKDGKVLRIYKNVKFPKLGVRDGGEVPSPSIYWRGLKSKIQATEIAEVAAGQWLESDWGKPLPDLFEQALYQQMGFALILLWPELHDADDESDPDENRTSKQRLADRRGRWAER